MVPACSNQVMGTGGTIHAVRYRMTLALGAQKANGECPGRFTVQLRSGFGNRQVDGTTSGF